MNNSMEVISLIIMLIISRDNYKISIEDCPLCVNVGGSVQGKDPLGPIENSRYILYIGETPIPGFSSGAHITYTNVDGAVKPHTLYTIPCKTWNSIVKCRTSSRVRIYRVSSLTKNSLR